MIQMPRSGDCERPAVPSFGRERAADGSAQFDETLHAPSPNQGLKKSADRSKANPICITGSTKRTPISWLNHPVPGLLTAKSVLTNKGLLIEAGLESEGHRTLLLGPNRSENTLLTLLFPSAYSECRSF